MSQSIYIVKVTKSYQWDGSESSNVLTTLDSAEAISFAKEYLENNLKLTVEIQGYDHLSVVVYSTILGQHNTEIKVWDSYYQRTTFSKHEDISKNMDFAFDLEVALIEKFKRNIDINIKNNHTLRPTIGWATGNSGLELSEQNQTVEVVEYAVDQYKHHLSSVSSEKLMSLSVALSPIESIKQDAASKENKVMWDLYETYEKEFYRS